MRTRSTVPGLLALLAACQSPTPGERPRTPAAAPADVAAACEALHSAPPQDWTEHLAPVVDAGAAAEPHLLRMLSARPQAPGAQASLATLGRVGGEASAAFCHRLVTQRAPLAVEAALALAELPGSAADEPLLACVQDQRCDPTLRTAAACALARHGERDFAPRWIAAIVRAGTPEGRADERVLGMPERASWTRERYFVQRTLRALGHDDLLEGFDAEAPWPALARLSPQVEARLRATGTPARPSAR